MSNEQILEKAKGLHYDSRNGHLIPFLNGYATARAEMLASATVVYFHKISEGNFNVGRVQLKNDTHWAYLIEQTEIKKEPCKHPKEMLVTFQARPGEAMCGVCNVELVAEWSEKK